MPRFKWTQTCI